MFGWLKKLFKKESGVDWYSPDERLIYRFWDGADGFSATNPNRRVDPMLVYDKVYAKRSEISADFKALDFPEQTQFSVPARSRLTKTIREIFDIKPLVDGMDLPEEGTLSEAETLLLLDDFLVFSERLKKNLSGSAGRQPTPSEPSSLFTDEVRPTLNGAASS